MAVTNFYTVNGVIEGEKTAGGTRVDYLTDALGSVTATVDSSAQVVNTYRYKPYGKLLAKTGSGADPSFSWVGSQGYRPTQRKFSDFYVRARHPDSYTGRWAVKDPHYSMGNKYKYVDGNPVSLTDPSGLVLKGGGKGQGCQSNYIRQLNDCCAKLDDLPKQISSIIDCMKQKEAAGGFPFNLGDLSHALGWLRNACSGDANNICIWCGPSVPPDWPPSCPYTCPATDYPIGTPGLVNPIHLIIVSPGGGFTPLPVPGNPLKPGNTGCPALGPTPGCSGLAKLKDGTQCSGAIVMCQPASDFDCATLLHELLHAGGLGGVGGRHRERPDTPGDDFIYALACCVCKALFGPDNPGCRDQCHDFPGEPQ